MQREIVWTALPRMIERGPSFANARFEALGNTRKAEQLQSAAVRREKIPMPELRSKDYLRGELRGKEYLRDNPPYKADSGAVELSVVRDDRQAPFPKRKHTSLAIFPS